MSAEAVIKQEIRQLNEEDPFDLRQEDQERIKLLKILAEANLIDVPLELKSQDLQNVKQKLDAV